VHDVALPDGRPLLRVLRFDRPSPAGPLIGIIRHAVRLPAAPGVPGAVDVATTITGSDIEALLRTLGDVEALLEDVRWDTGDDGRGRERRAPGTAEEKEKAWTAS
jgi:hypothetical protein